ncbi:hypothetical protein B5M09_013088, partial [Aphanomyces astaci]
MKILDAESRVGRMLDELMRSLEQDHQGWTAVQKQLQLQRNKTLKSDIFRYVNWLRTFAAGHQLYVGLDDESKPSPTAKTVEAPRGCRPQFPRREGGREDAAKNNGRVGGKSETIVPKNAEPSAKKGCLKCGENESPCSAVPEDRAWRSRNVVGSASEGLEGRHQGVNQPQRQKTERGVMLENIVHVDDVLLDSGSDVIVVTRGVMDALDAAGVE